MEEGEVGKVGEEEEVGEAEEGEAAGEERAYSVDDLVESIKLCSKSKSAVKAASVKYPENVKETKEANQLTERQRMIMRAYIHSKLETDSQWMCQARQDILKLSNTCFSRHVLQVLKDYLNLNKHPKVTKNAMSKVTAFRSRRVQALKKAAL